jgi:hypothetical protein
MIRSSAARSSLRRASCHARISLTVCIAISGGSSTRPDAPAIRTTHSFTGQSPGGEPFPTPVLRPAYSLVKKAPGGGANGRGALEGEPTYDFGWLWKELGLQEERAHHLLDHLRPEEIEEFRESLRVDLGLGD